MNIDLSKTMGYDMAKRAGVAALHQTMTNTENAGISEQIQSDLTMLTNQAINTLLNAPMKPGATLPMAQLVGYLGELALLTGTLAAGLSFELQQDPLGDTSLHVSKQTAPAARTLRQFLSASSTEETK